MLDLILPETVVVVGSSCDLESGLFPEEEWLVRHAIESRRREFTTTRACARDALGRLGLPSQSIPAGPDGIPIWPPTIVGSLAHCNQYRVAAVARKREFNTIGIDVEPHRRLAAGVLDAIATPDEREHVHGLLHDSPTVCWDRLLFSIKEAVYKAWYPVTGQGLGFEEASVVIDLPSQKFSVQLRALGKVSGANELDLSGRWVVSDGLIGTAIASPTTA